MHKSPPGPQAREVLLDAILDDSNAERLVLSDANFFRTPATAMAQGQLYPAAPRRMMRMTQLFPNDTIEVFMAIRNPASLVPILHKLSANAAPADFWGAKSPLDIKWSQTIGAMRLAAPNLPITVWCNEDAPLIWGQIIRLIAGLPDDMQITGSFDLLSSIMSKEGMQRFRDYLAAHPDITEPQRRRVTIAFLDKFALADKIEEELDMPGWDDALVAQMTERYDQDVAVIQQMEGVRVLMP